MADLATPLLLILLPILVVIIIAVIASENAKEKRAQFLAELSALRPSTLAFGERILWETVGKEGVYIAFTNRRAMAYRGDSRNMKNEGSIDKCDLVATNVHRRSTGGGSRVYGYRTSYGSWNSSSSSYGTLQCLSPMGPIFTISGVTDPHGVVRLFNAAKREYKASLKTGRI